MYSYSIDRIIYAITTDDTLVTYSLPGQNSTGFISQKLAEIAKDVLDVSPDYYVTKSGKLFSINPEKTQVGRNFEPKFINDNVRSVDSYSGNGDVWVCFCGC